MYFDLICGNDICGSVSATREGLYLKLCCRCDLPEKRIYHVIIQSDKNAVDLGVCVPKDDCFGIDTRIPIRSINTDSMRFLLTEKGIHQKKDQISLEESKPFPYLEQLDSAYLCPDKVTIAFQCNQPGTEF